MSIDDDDDENLTEYERARNKRPGLYTLKAGEDPAVVLQALIDGWNLCDHTGDWFENCEHAAKICGLIPPVYDDE